MRRAFVLLVTAAALAGCGEEDEFAAKVGTTEISEAQIERVLEHGAEEAKREGRDFPEEGTPEFREVRKQVLENLVFLEELRQKAVAVGVRVPPRQRAGEEGEEEGEEEAELEAFERANRGRPPPSRIVYSRLYKQVTKNVRVTEAEIRRAFDRDAAAYRRRYGSYADAREAIRLGLVNSKRTTVWLRFLDGVRREYEPRVEYSEEFAPDSGD